MTTPAIEVSHLTKEYRLGALQSLKDTALNAGRRLLGKPVAERPLFKALDDVSFTVQPGEVVGIIGHNGAGKSTLLKMLARISTPTSGTVKVNGRIAPLIEVGAGFVPDFTGRENVYLNGAILGMSKAEIDRKFDEIVDFAEMADFIDTPVKRYSSGMQVKLAFAVATSVESEILIVDEVLAVGDLAFQRKCFDRMEEIIRNEGRAVIVVSHNIRQIERICERALLIDHGLLVEDGSAQTVCERFYEQSNSRIEANMAARSRTRIAGSGELTLLNVSVLDKNGEPAAAIAPGEPLRVRLRFELHRAMDDLEIVVGTHRTDFVYITASSTRSQLPALSLGAGMHEIEYYLPSYPVATGTYSVRMVVMDRHHRVLFDGESLRSFVVRSPRAEPLNQQWKIVEAPAEFRFIDSPKHIETKPRPTSVSPESQDMSIRA
ncbi:ABC transporter ATP-binding protein [Azohydromonas sediminis]|uniref:ABC transporter ATP-binding protein n=1 Tax=Azohydromonas sediminis TaxID=2259674 RepID=UPI000E65846F|nr:ABC transporter ATP-binding protein [Azohydromonas sediminis]